MIDPLETVLAYLRQDITLAGLVDDRIAGKAQYGDNWGVDEPALVVQLDSGKFDNYAPIHRPGITAIAYATETVDALEIITRVAEIASQADRETVPTANGDALLYFLLPTTEPTLTYDDEANLETAIMFFDAQVSRDPI